jgi:hypothetical protein
MLPVLTVNAEILKLVTAIMMLLGMHWSSRKFHSRQCTDQGACPEGVYVPRKKVKDQWVRKCYIKTTATLFAQRHGVQKFEFE